MRILQDPHENPFIRRLGRDHHGAAVADEGVPQDLRQLGAPEGDVLVALVQRPDALLWARGRGWVGMWCDVE